MTSYIVRKTETKCATCGKQLLFKKRQAGHFISRMVYATRWDFENVHVQCDKCNVEKGGNLRKYREWVRQKYGEKTLERLECEKEKYNNGTSDFTLKNACLRYNELLQEIKKFTNDPKLNSTIEKWTMIQFD